MGQLIECIPNFSVGDDKKVVAGLVEIASHAKGVTVLDVNTDTDHNRTGIAMLGSPENILHTAFELVKYAAEHIDLNNHTGGHPRMGATDVVPFVPIKEITMDECVDLSKQFSKRVNDHLAIPIFLYEDSAVI